MFSMNQARYSTLFSCVVFASSQFHRPQPLANSPSKTSQKPATNVHHFTLKKVYTYTGSLQKNHTPELEVYAQEKHTAEVDYDIYFK